MPGPPVEEFDDWMGSARGLLARPVLPNGQNATKDNISAIHYSAHLRGSADPPIEGDLVVNDVMYSVPQPWPNNKDKIGYTFLWPSPGTNWATEGQWRVIVFFTTISALGSQQFIRVWQANTFNPNG